MLANIILLGEILAPTVGALIAALLPDRFKPFIVSVASSALSFAFYIILVSSSTPPLHAHVGHPLILFRIDALSNTLAGVTTLIGLLSIIYSYGYLSPYNREHPIRSGWSRYYSLMLIFEASMLGASYSATLLTFLIFYELTSLCSYMLISFYGGEADKKAGLKAFILTGIGGLMLLLALSMCYAYTGRLDFNALPLLHGAPLLVVLTLILVASWAKSAQPPFHTWLIDAMVAPTPVTAYLHSASMVCLGVYLWARCLEPLILAHSVSSVVPLALASTILGLATAYYMGVMYYQAKDLKELLAYSTIAHLGIMFAITSLGVLQGVVYGVYAAMYYLWNHAFTKALLFLSIGSISYAIGARSIEVLTSRHLSHSDVAALGFIVGSLSIAAIPPLNMFFSKIAVLVLGLRGPLIALIVAVLILVEGYILTLPVFSRLSISLLRGSGGTGSEYEIPLAMRATILALVVSAVVSAFTTPLSRFLYW